MSCCSTVFYGTRDLGSRLFGVSSRVANDSMMRGRLFSLRMLKPQPSPATPLGSVTGITSLTLQFWYAVIVASYFWVVSAGSRR